MRPDLFIKTPSFIGQRERTRGAPQQPRPHALFQPRQCAADTRGRHSQGFRGPRDGPRLDHRDEHRQSRKQLAVEGHMIPDRNSRLSSHKRCCSTNADAGYCFPLRQKAIFKGAANMYAVTGITGKVGAAVARSLLSADQRVRAVVRDRSKGAAWAELGCEVAVADFADAGALTKAFEGRKVSLRCCRRYSTRRPDFPKPGNSLRRCIQLLPLRSQKKWWHSRRSAPMRPTPIY